MVDQPKPLPQPDDYDDDGEWQELINSVEATDIPIDMLKVLRVHLKDGTKFIFPIKEWLDQGSSIDDIDMAVTKWYKAHDDNIAGSDFIVDLNKLKATVRQETKRTLKGL